MVLGAAKGRNERRSGQVNDNEKIEEWTRYIKACCLQETKLTQLAHLPRGIRIEVLKKLGAKVAEDVFTVTEDKP